ncbi:imelysin family protein [Caldimonas brevitalea]|uniref:Imelysin-like domain-containing protein n=1 Tax=Caldimonas brevitalea TaxID=413882 RepID=A0A0G3BFE5_9BURK|nr:imelysin family protein [Caldimonas brevitalea]AKJ28174.1 hypothetical protein AAW51_1483 [Caldimonas brevitalea]
MKKKAWHCCVLAATLLAASRMAWAADAAPVVAVPYYTPAAFMQGLQRHWYLPRAAEFARHAEALPPALQALCAAPPARTEPARARAREQWRDTTLAWEQLSMVPAAPLVARRSVRQIDFTPPRPELIQRAIEQAPGDAQAMERIGAPAKGLPALEWLLWPQALKPATPACRYAEQVAADIAREAAALQAEFQQATAQAADDDERAGQQMAEWVNQWMGAVERLRWQDLERPQRSRDSTSRRSETWPRAASGLTQQSWAARWRAVHTLVAAQPGQPAPSPGSGLVPLETYLRGRGRNDVADHVAATAGRVDKAIAAAKPKSARTVLAAAAALADLKRLGEQELAPALQVTLGFSDADGD